MSDDISPMTLRYDHFSGAEVAVPLWMPDAHISTTRMRGGGYEVALNVSWAGEGWVLIGSGQSEIAAANDLVRKLKGVR